MTKQPESQKNKSHKTLRDKLRKKRQELKTLKKEKKIRHQSHDTQTKKQSFLEHKRRGKKKREDGIKEHKLGKHIEGFVDVYEDNVEDFYEIFRTFDQGGSIDIGDVSDLRVQKCLKKIFKYLPLKKCKHQYQLQEKATTKLEPLIKNMLTRSIQHYLEHGTDSEQAQSSDDDQVQTYKTKSVQPADNLIKVEAKGQEAVNREEEQLKEYESLQLYKTGQGDGAEPMGPSITEEQRPQLAQMFDNRPEQNQMDAKEGQGTDNDGVGADAYFQRLFSMTSTNKEQKQREKQPNKSKIEDIPEHLLAEGSAQIGQKSQIDLNCIEEYNRAHRPRKLIEEHQEMMKLGKFTEDHANKRKAFDWERDIVNGRSRKSLMNNSVFFDFKDKMKKPQTTNNFL